MNDKQTITPPESKETVEELLRTIARLQEDVRQRSSNLASAAHELRTPLSIVAGYIELLASREPGPLNERQLKILNDVIVNCGRLQNMVQNFLALGAVEAGNLHLRLENFDLNKCLAELYDMWLERFQSRGVALYFPTEDCVKPFPFDCAKIQHVVSNLLENALKFTPAGGTVWLMASPHNWELPADRKPLTFGEKRSGPARDSAVRVTVADTGPGIPPEYHLDIFTDFFRVPACGGPDEGMGLGLAIARRLVLAHGGKIWVESEPGMGAKFSFLLPLRQGQGAQLEGETTHDE